MAKPDRSSVTPTLEQIGKRHGLSSPSLDQLRTLLELVVTDPLAPTSVRDPAGVLKDHIADSLVALEMPLLESPLRAVDIGSGAGFPGLALAIARPDTTFVLVEASSRKCAFIERAVARCSLANVEVMNTRVEAWPEGVGCFDLAMARAVGQLEVVLEYAAPLLRRGGWLISWRGSREPEAEARANHAAGLLGMQVGVVRHVIPYPGAVNRHLHTATKVVETPERFPRRPGVASKRPLGAPNEISSDRMRR